MKKLLCMLMALAMLLAVTACGAAGGSASGNPSAPEPEASASAPETSASAPEANGDAKDSILIGISVSDKDSTSDMMKSLLEQHAAAYAEETGTEVNFTWTFCEASVDTQITDVESLITMGCDVIAIRVTDTEGCNVCFEACKDAGVPCIAMWNGGIGADLDIFAVDNYVIGQRQAEWLINYADEHPDETYVCGYLDGISTAADTLLRCSGFCDTIEEKYGDLTSGQIQVIATDYSENSTDTSISIAEDWLTRFPEMNCVVGWNDTAAYGGMQAFIAQGYNNPDDYMIVGCDATDYLDEVSTGEMDMTIGITFTPAIQQVWDVAINLAVGNHDAAAEYAAAVSDSYFCVTADSMEEWRTIAGLN